jgi:hypothetical protein
MLQVEDEMDSRYRPDKSIEEEASDFDDEFDYHDIKEEKKEEELHSSDRAGQNANEFGAFDFSSPDEIQESEWLDFCNSCTEEELSRILESIIDKEEKKASEPSQVEDLDTDNVTNIHQIVKEGDDDYGNVQTKDNADVHHRQHSTKCGSVISLEDESWVEAESDADFSVIVPPESIAGSVELWEEIECSTTMDVISLASQDDSSSSYYFNSYMDALTGGRSLSDVTLQKSKASSAPELDLRLVKVSASADFAEDFDADFIRDGVKLARGGNLKSQFKGNNCTNKNRPRNRRRQFSR